MKKIDIELNQQIEDRIEMEIVVDAYNEQERAMGWYYYLNDNINFPFKAKFITKSSKNLMTKCNIVEVIGMDEAENCEYDMLVQISWQEDIISVSLKQIEGIELDKKTKQVLYDWSYWLSHNYCF